MARDFAANDYLLWSSDAPISDYPFTLSFWFRSDVAISTSDIWIMFMQRSGTANQRINIGLYDNVSLGVVRCNINDAGGSGNSVDLQTVNTATDTAWHHVFLRASESGGTVTADIILDGDVANSGNASGTEPVITAHDRSWINGYNNAASGTAPTALFFDGALGMFSFWNVALPTSVSTALAAGAHPNRFAPTALVHQLPVWGLHDPEIDLGTSHNSSYANTGTAILNDGPPVELWEPGRTVWFPGPVSAATTVNLGVLALDITMVALSVQTGVTVALATQALDITMQALTVQTGTSVELGTIALDITMGALTVQTGVTVELGVILLDITMQAITVETTTSVALGVIAMDIALQPLSVSTGVTVALGTVALDITLKALSVSIPAQVTTTVELGTVLMVLSIPEVFSVQVSDGISTSVRVVLDVIPMKFYLQPLNKPYNRCGTVVFKADPSEVVTYLADPSEVVGYSADASETVTFQACAN